MFHTRCEMVAGKTVLAFAGISSRARDQFGKIAVPGAILRKHYEAQSIVEPELGTDDQLEFIFVFPGRDMGAHHAGERAFVGNRERLVTALDGGLDQLLRMGCAAQKSEIGQAMKLGIIHERLSCKNAVQEPLFAACSFPKQPHFHARPIARDEIIPLHVEIVPPAGF